MILRNFLDRTTQLQNTIPFDFCNFCLSNVSIHSHHCTKCDRCVYKLDHHCDWMNNCIAEGNYM